MSDESWTSKPDGDWDRLAVQWAAEPEPSPPVPTDLNQWVARRGRGLRVRAALDYAVSGSLLAFSILWFVTHPTPTFLAWAVGLWAFTLVALAFGVWNRRGLWAPPEETPTAYVRLSRERTRRYRLRVRFAWVLLIAEIVFLVLFEKLAAPPGGWTAGFLLTYYGLLIAVSAAYVGGLLWQGRRGAREARRLDALEAELG